MRRKLRITVSTIAALAAPLAFAGGEAAAQQQPPQFPNMSFFITSTGGPKGADYGGLTGADAHCQALAEKAGAGAKTWRAYLSAQATGGTQAVNARDRIGKGPWFNAAGTRIATDVADLHSPHNRIDTENGLAETGRRIPSRLFVVNQHDILTGSLEDGTAPPADKDMTCGNWTKSGEGTAMVGHHDRMGLRDDAPSKSWNASHPSRGCSADALKSSGGAGLLYCFAAN
ncbi:MAG TPA: lectin [Vineibacter sp.]|nr:lectin [Vineibacter sp.]